MIIGKLESFFQRGLLVLFITWFWIDTLGQQHGKKFKRKVFGAVIHNQAKTILVNNGFTYLSFTSVT